MVAAKKLLILRAKTCTGPREGIEATFIINRQHITIYNILCRRIRTS